MNTGKFLLWSTILSLPTLFLLRKKRPGMVSPGPEEVLDNGEVIVTDPSAPPEPFDMTMPAEFRTFKTPAELSGYSRMRGADVPAAILSQLRPLLAGALGTVTKLPFENRDIAAVIEPHYHTPGGPVKPWGWHKGVTLYERKGALA